MPSESQGRIRTSLQSKLGRGIKFPEIVYLGGNIKGYLHNAANLKNNTENKIKLVLHAGK